MEVKTAIPADWNQINEFLDKSLRPNVQWSLKDEYPLAFNERNHKNIHLIKEQDEVIAHAVLQPTLIKTHYHLFKVGLIGSVVTEETQRGKGYSSEIIKSCLSSAQQQECDLTMLWTDLFQFYSQFGFEVAGSEVALIADDQFKGEMKTGIKILETPQVAADALLRLFNKHNLRSVRTLKDIHSFLRIPNTEVYTAWNTTTNQIEAYCIMGKGADFTNYIHEWGGQVSSIVSLIKHIQENKKQPITLITPPQCTNLIKQMKQAGATNHSGVLGMIAISNPVSFCKKIKKGARALGYDAFIFDFREGRYYFGYGDEIYQTDSSQDIIRLVFGPATPDQIHNFSPEALTPLSEIFPIPFWVWGWDSI